MRLDPQVHPQQLPRDVQVLRVLQRFAEHRVDAFRGCAMDIPEQQWRIRVQPHSLIKSCLLNWPSTRLRRLGVNPGVLFSSLRFQ